MLDWKCEKLSAGRPPSYWGGIGRESAMCTLVSCDQRGRATAQHRHSRCGDQPQRAEARAFRVLCFVCM